MIKRLILLLLFLITNKKNRQRFLIAQYIRSKLLPKWGINKINNHVATDPHQSIDISILITCYNYSRLVSQAINSVIQAELSELSIEIIVINDASTDDSQSTLESYFKHTTHPFSIITTWWNVGLTRARNLALSHARGKYIFILDADNTIKPSALNVLYDTAQKTQASAAYGPIQRVLMDGTEDGFLSNEPFNSDRLTIGNYIDAMALFHTTTLKNLGGYNEELIGMIGGWEDYDMWLQLANQSLTVAFNPCIIGHYLVKPDSMVKKITASEMASAMHYFRNKYQNLSWPD